MKRNSFLAFLLSAALILGVVPSQTMAVQQKAVRLTASTAEKLSGQVSVRFESNGGYGQAPDAITVPFGQSVTLPRADLTIRLGTDKLRFSGWAADVSASSPEYLAGSEITLTSDLTLYAVFSSEDCQVTYRTGDSVSTETVIMGETPKKVPSLPKDYVGWRDSSGRSVDPAETQIWGNQVFTAYRTPVLNTQDHSRYMNGTSDGLFHPDRTMTRAEAAQVLYDLLVEKPTGRVSFTDVPDGAWYADEVAALGSAGILTADGSGAFHPNDAITRGDFAVILSSFVPADAEMKTFTDVSSSHPAYQAIGVTAAYGLFGGYPDGTFQPAAALSRAEAAAVFNKLLGRTADAAAVSTSPSVRVFPDVPTSHWAYYQIMEATVSHGYSQDANGSERWTQVQVERTALADGYHNIGGWLYRVQDGVFLRNTTVDGFTYDTNGRYTTGSATLDQKLHNIIVKYTNDSMTRDQKLRALYNYVRDNYSYLKRPLIAKGQTGWEPAYAEEFLNKGKGNCFSFSATYCLLARQLGLPAYTVVGGLGRNASPHGWVEIELDGATYMFDTQLEWRYLHDYGLKGYNLFKMLPSKTPFIYTR